MVPITDKSGHTIAAGEPYLSVIYLDGKSKSNQNSKLFEGKKCQTVYIHIEEVFTTNIELS